MASYGNYIVTFSDLCHSMPRPPVTPLPRYFEAKNSNTLKCCGCYPLPRFERKAYIMLTRGNKGVLPGILPPKICMMGVTRYHITRYLLPLLFLYDATLVYREVCAPRVYIGGIPCEAF